MDPTFTIEDDKIGIGSCVVAKWKDGRREVVSGFGDHSQAARWIQSDSEHWLLSIPTQVQGEQWINDRLPKAD